MLLYHRIAYYKEFKKDNEYLVKHIDMLEKDIEINRRKFELLKIDNTSLKAEVQFLKAESKEKALQK